MNAPVRLEKPSVDASSNGFMAAKTAEGAKKFEAYMRDMFVAAGFAVPQEPAGCPVGAVKVRNSPEYFGKR